MTEIKLKAGETIPMLNGTYTAPFAGVYSVSNSGVIMVSKIEDKLYNAENSITFPNGSILVYTKTVDAETLRGIYPTRDSDITQKCDEVLNWVREKYNLTDSECDDIYLAGGAIRSLIIGEDVRDFDIFVTCNSLKVKLIKLAKENSYGYVSDNAITHYTLFGQVQIITTATGYPWDIVAEFDFVMNQNYYYKYLATLTDNPLKIGCRDTILAKKLTINQNCRNKLGTLARLIKFIERGYTPPSKFDMVALGIAISKLNPITTLTELVSESKLYLNVEEVSTLCDGTILETCTDEEFEALNNRGSGL